MSEEPTLTQRVVATARSAVRIGASAEPCGYLDRDPERRAQSFRHSHPQAAAEASTAWSRALAFRQAATREADRAREVTVTVTVQPVFEEWE